MTLGTGLFLSTVLILTALGVHQISKHGKWKVIGKWIGASIALSALLGLALWGWFKYQERPQVVEALGGVRLGMSQQDVKLAKGKPIDLFDDDGKPITDTWYFQQSEQTSTFLSVRFAGSTPELLKVSVVCEEDGYLTVQGFSSKGSSSEEDVLNKLGPPTSTAVRSDGFGKLISYAAYKVGYEIEKGLVTKVCIASDGKVTYDYLTK